MQVLIVRGMQLPLGVSKDFLQASHLEDSNVRVSNLAMYISNFTPPDVLQTTAQTVFLLVDNFKDKISNYH